MQCRYFVFVLLLRFYTMNTKKRKAKKRKAKKRKAKIESFPESEGHVGKLQAAAATAETPSYGAPNQVGSEPKYSAGSSAVSSETSASQATTRPTSTCTTAHSNLIGSSLYDKIKQETKPT